jgi:hypothetical protein
LIDIVPVRPNPGPITSSTARAWHWFPLTTVGAILAPFCAIRVGRGCRRHNVFGSRIARAFATFAVTSLVFTIATAGIARAADDAEEFHQLKGKELHAASPFRQTGGNLIDHGGPVISNAHLYAIWWGTPSSFPSDANAGLTNLLTNFGGSQYLQVAAQYMRGAALSTSFVQSFTDTSAPTSKPSTSSLQSEIQKVLNANGATPDPNGVYFVFTTNFPRGANYCAWHSGASVNGVAIAQAYMPNTAGIAGCDPGNAYNANSYSQGTRSIANVTAHELIEALTDKLPGGSTTAWIDSQGAEVSDKCAWKFANKVLIGATYWQLQENWSNAVSGCVQQ